MFGELTVELGERVLGAGDFGGVKPKQLLEVLLLDRGRTVSKDRIADSLWGEQLPQRVAPTIETYVSLLRKTLAEGDRAPHPLGRGLISTERGGYRVRQDQLTVDVDRFEALIREAAAQPLRERRASLERATELSTEELLSDEPYADWVQAPRAHYQAQRVQALIDLAECCQRLGDHPAAADAADRALRIEPGSERACRVAMQSLAARGETDRSLRVFEACRTALLDLVGAPPGRETLDVRAAILHGEQIEAAAGRTPVAYADNDGVRLAYQVVGSGPVDLAFVPSFVTNLGATWDDPTYADFLHKLAAMSRLILFDKRGTGLSDPALDFPTTRQRSDDLAAVLDAAGSRRCVLFGTCAGAALSVQFAFDHPSRTAALILFGGFARMLQTPDYPWGWPAERYAQLLDSFEIAWLGAGDRISRRNPGLADNPRYRQWYARYIRLAANPFMARRLTEMNADIDIRDLLPSVAAPTLVMVNDQDAWMSPQNSRYLAEHIPGAQLVTITGTDHDPWTGDTRPVLEAIKAFLAAQSSPDQAFVAQKT
jgi:pimeloyl-ACP methyl ester carboxylesterase/DNA-binding SARP family transcriptional activator